MNTSIDLNIIPLESYDILIEMDWLEKHHDVLDFHNKTFTCLDGNGKQRTVKGVPRPISIREISSLQLKICFRKGCQLYAAHVEEPDNTKGPSLKDFSVLQEFEDVFKEIPGFPPRREIDFSIDLVLGVVLGVKNTLHNEHTRVKRIKNVIGRIVEERVHTSKCFTLGSTNTFC
jgi:hypothetical protein